jgi:hypothetical protein
MRRDRREADDRADAPRIAPRAASACDPMSGRLLRLSVPPATITRKDAP